MSIKGVAKSTSSFKLDRQDSGNNVKSKSMKIEKKPLVITSSQTKGNCNIAKPKCKKESPKKMHFFEYYIEYKYCYFKNKLKTESYIETNANIKNVKKITKSCVRPNIIQNKPNSRYKDREMLPCKNNLSRKSSKTSVNLSRNQSTDLIIEDKVKDSLNKISQFATDTNILIKKMHSNDPDNYSTSASYCSQNKINIENLVYQENNEKYNSFCTQNLKNKSGQISDESKDKEGHSCSKLSNKYHKDSAEIVEHKSKIDPKQSISVLKSLNFEQIEKKKDYKGSSIVMNDVKDSINFRSSNSALSTSMKISRDSSSKHKNYNSNSNSVNSKISSTDKINKHHKNLLEKNKVQELASKWKLKAPEVPYIFVKGGPILISAPHTLPVDRLSDAGEYKCKHKREKYAAEIATRIALELKTHLGQAASLLLWDPRGQYQKTNMDPNYLSLSNLQHSPFHQAIHKFIEMYKDSGTPVLHIDVHGKMDRKTDLNMDIGTTALRTYWWQGKMFQQSVVQNLEGYCQSCFSKIDKVFSDHKKFSYDLSPYLDGCWIDDRVNTMVMQGVKLGVPGMQLELPYTMRSTVVWDSVILKKIVEMIGNFYNEFVSDWYRQYNCSANLKYNPDIFKNLKVCKYSDLDYLVLIETCRNLEAAAKEKMI